MDVLSGRVLAVPLSTWLTNILPTLIVFYLVSWTFYTRTLHPLASIPGPFWASISRLWYIYRIYVGDMHEVQRRLHHRYGPIVRIAPNEVSTTEVSAIPKIYKHQRPLTKTDFYSAWGGGGSITKRLDTFAQPDEKEHSNYRRIVNPVYTLSNVLKSEGYINKVSALFIKRLGEHADRKETIDLGQWLQMYAFDVIGETMFGDMFGFLEKSEDHGTFIASLDALMPFSCICAVAPTYLRPLILGSAIFIPAAFRAVKSIDGIRKAAVIATAKRLKENQDGVEHRNDMLQQLFDIVEQKGDEANFSVKEATLEAFVAMFAGSDTTAIAFRATFYYLMKNPKALAKAHVEIDAALAAGSLSSPVRYTETMAKLPYVCASIKEAMRMHPSVGLNIPRYSPDEGMELAGQFIPRGYRVGLNPAVVHYVKEMFGDDADSFRPERWLVSDEHSKAMDKGLLTFGAGTRTCIGKNISLVELHTLVPEVLKQFDLQLAHDRPWKTSNRWFNKQTDVVVHVTRR